MSTDLIEHAVRLLVENNIHSLPVLHPDTLKCLGFVDVGDILSYIVRSIPKFPTDFLNNSLFQFEKSHSTQNSRKNREFTIDARVGVHVIDGEGNSQILEIEDTGKEINAILKQLDVFDEAITNRSIGILIDESGDDPFFMTTPSTPAIRVVDLFARGIRRVPILESQNAIGIADIYSQSQFVQFIYDNLFMVPRISNTKIRDLEGLRFYETVSVDIKETVIYALRTLHTYSCQAVALVNANGRLVGNFSQMDIGGLYIDTIPSFTDPLSAYLARISPLSLNPVSCDLNATFGAVIESLVTNKVSRTWVIDENEKPIGSIDLTDVCRIIYDFKE
ncbi:hypothetical protein HK096_010738 [Nowakowskiella sp. JEL0078]|nr:hypothetical protein HK096_010738 [Nowakowskiella sp. JEL0078]